MKSYKRLSIYKHPDLFSSLSALRNWTFAAAQRPQCSSSTLSFLLRSSDLASWHDKGQLSITSKQEYSVKHTPAPEDLQQKSRGSEADRLIFQPLSLIVFGQALSSLKKKNEEKTGTLMDFFLLLQLDKRCFYRYFRSAIM